MKGKLLRVSVADVSSCFVDDSQTTFPQAVNQPFDDLEWVVKNLETK
jgi:hypothetical protein